MEGERRKSRRRKDGTKRKRNALNTSLHWPLPPWHSLYIRGDYAQITSAHSHSKSMRTPFHI
jgi:hypothetical protein